MFTEQIEGWKYDYYANYIGFSTIVWIDIIIGFEESCYQISSFWVQIALRAYVFNFGLCDNFNLSKY